MAQSQYPEDLITMVQEALCNAEQVSVKLGSGILPVLFLSKESQIHPYCKSCRNSVYLQKDEKDDALLGFCNKCRLKWKVEYTCPLLSSLFPGDFEENCGLRLRSSSQWSDA